MRHFTQNPKWLRLFAPFRALSVSAAYLVPFFLERGLDQTDIFVLQSIFSVAVVLWELPSGYIADRLGRARSIKLSVPLAALSMVAYGFSTEFWQFVLCELLLAVAYGLISGADSALLYDSLEAAGREKEYEKTSKRINAMMFVSTAVGLPLSLLLVSQWGVASTLVADGLLTMLGGYFAWQLVEPPAHGDSRVEATKSALHALRHASRKKEVRWLLVLSMALSTGTYLGAWLSAPAYQSVGIPVALFAALLAARSLWKAGWSHWYHPVHRPGEHMLGYATLVAAGFVGMASGQWWLLLVLGHDFVQAMQGPALMQRLNRHVPHSRHRATLNSAVNLLQRLAYATVGPFVGLMADTGGLQAGLLAAGALCSGAAFFALCRLYRLGTFKRG